MAEVALFQQNAYLKGSGIERSSDAGRGDAGGARAPTAQPFKQLPPRVAAGFRGEEGAADNDLAPDAALANARNLVRNVNLLFDKVRRR